MKLKSFLSLGSATALVVLLTQLAGASVTIPTEGQRREEARAAFKDWLFETSAKGRNPRFNGDFSFNDHLTFSSRTEALQWANQFLTSFQKSFNDPNIKILQNDPRYLILDSYVQELWTAFTALFPAHTAGLNAPPVILLETKESNAFVRRSGDGKQIAHAIFVFTGLLDVFSKEGKLSKDLITSVIGHELAHSVFLHGLPKYQKRMNHFYNRQKLVFGYQANQSSDTPALDKAMEGWLTGAFLAGELTASDLKDLPSPGVGRSILMGAFRQMHTDVINATCPTGKAAYSNWRSQIRFSSLKNALEIIPQDQRPPGSPALDLAQASDELLTEDRACLGTSKLSLLELAAKSFAIPLENLKSSEAFMQLEKEFTTSQDPMSGFQKIIAPIRSEMKKIESNISFDDLGYYTYEEHADEVSALLHTYLNRKADALGSAFMVFLKESSPDDAATCGQMLAMNNEPPNGSFSDPHRSLCYRMYHLGKFSNAIGQDVKGFAGQFITTSLGPSTPLDQGPLGIIFRSVR